MSSPGNRLHWKDCGNKAEHCVGSSGILQPPVCIKSVRQTSCEPQLAEAGQELGAETG